MRGRGERFGCTRLLPEAPEVWGQGEACWMSSPSLRPGRGYHTQLSPFLLCHQTITCSCLCVLPFLSLGPLEGTGGGP